MDFEIIRLTKERISHLIPLYKAAFGKTFALDYLKKKFDTSAFGGNYWAHIAYNEKQEAIAFYAVFACKLLQNKEDILAAQSADTMTHPSYQGKGLFTRLARMTFDLALKEDCQFIFGFPNQNSLPGFIKKLDWINQEELIEYTIPINTLPLLPLLSKSKRIHSVYTNLIKRLFPISNYNFSSSNVIIDSHLIGLKRNQQFRNYKMYEGSFITQIEGKNIWIKLDHRLLIGEIEKVNQTELFTILKKLQNRCVILGIRKIVFQLSPAIYINEMLTNYPGIQIKSTLPFCYLNGTKIEVNQVGFTSLDWDTF